MARGRGEGGGGGGWGEGLLTSLSVASKTEKDFLKKRMSE